MFLPSVEDYFLENEAGYGIPDVPRLVVDSNTGKIKITISGDITPSTTPITISEAGIEVMVYATDGDARILSKCLGIAMMFIYASSYNIYILTG